MFEYIKNALVGLALVTSIGCADDWDCQDLEPRNYGEFTVETQFCDWGTDDWDQDNDDVVFMKLKDQDNATICEAELNPTDDPFIFNVKSFQCEGMDLPELKNTELHYNGQTLCLTQRDDNDRPILKICDTNKDTVIDKITVWQYGGNKTTELHDDQADGIFDIKKEYVNNQLIKESLEANEKGIFKIIKEYVDGQLVKESIDKNLDGTPDWVEEYNSEGLLTKLARTKDDGRTLTSYYWYDDQGRKILSRSDSETDGVIDYEIATVYNEIEFTITTEFENGKITSVERREFHDGFERRLSDMNANGVFELMREYVHIGAGNSLWISTEAKDKDEDGVWDEIITKNKQGKMEAVKTLFGDKYHLVRYGYDKDGNRNLIISDYDGNGVDDIIYKYIFENGEKFSKTTIITGSYGDSKKMIFYKTVDNIVTDPNCPDKFQYKDSYVDEHADGTWDWIEYSVCNDNGYQQGTEKIPL